MKYDKDLIKAIYIIQQNDPQLAERMWDRLTKEKQPEKKIKDLYVGNIRVPEHIVLYLEKNHNKLDKPAAIRALRQRTGCGLKEAIDVINYMISINAIS